MKYIEAPQEYDIRLLSDSLFLAGGITNCPEWQSEMVMLLSDTDITILNPRRKNFPIDDPEAARQQITWEFHALRDVDTISFWFCKETICPIVLYELGTWNVSDKHIFIGMDPEYQRRQDVEIQTKLVRPDLEIVYSLLDLSKQIIAFYQDTKTFMT